MGKPEEEQVLAAEEPQEAAEGGAAPDERCRWGNAVRIRCVVALVLGVALLLSAVFWLPPFLRRGGDRWGYGGDGAFGADIVASFRLQKPVPLLKESILKLERDILEEIEAPNAMVLVVSLEPVAGLNMTTVVFGVWPYAKGSSISPYGISLIRASFHSLVIDQSTLHLTPSLFGDSSFFQVLKFPGGITVTPQQSAFPLQKVQILFNFTLNFSIQQIQEVIEELKDQLNSFLHLTQYEILYIKLTNLHGSTIAIPTIVQASVLLAVGNLPPPIPRLKQLAQAIKGSPRENLGLSHAVFGKVKQIQLSSYMQRSLTSGSPNSSQSPVPAPVPLPYPGPSPHFSNRHHHHHHRPYYHHQAAIPAPSPTPVSQHKYYAPPPTNCWFWPHRKHKGKTHLVPIPGPAISPSVHFLPPSPSHADIPSSPLSHPVASPLPTVLSPPSNSQPLSSPPATRAHPSSGKSMSVVSPSPSPFSGAGLTTTTRCTEWAFMLFVYLLLPW